MTKASDNIFARLLLDAVTSDPAAPSNDNWELFARVNGIYARNSNTTVGPVVFGTALANPMTTLGDIIYSSDGIGTATRLAIGSNGQLLRTTASSIPGWDMPPGFEIDYAQFTASVSVTATDPTAADTVVSAHAVTFDGSTAVYIHFSADYIQPTTTAAASISIWLYDGSNIGRMQICTTPAGTNALRVPGSAWRKLIPSAGSHTYSIRASVSTGTGTVSAGIGGSGTALPGFIRIVKA